MAKLTLSVDSAVVARAKRYAKACGVSVSQLVEAYLGSLSGPAPLSQPPPVLQSVRGILKNADRNDYSRYLAEKHR